MAGDRDHGRPFIFSISILLLFFFSSSALSLLCASLCRPLSFSSTALPHLLGLLLNLQKTSPDPRPLWMLQFLSEFSCPYFLLGLAWFIMLLVQRRTYKVCISKLGRVD